MQNSQNLSPKTSPMVRLFQYSRTYRRIAIKATLCSVLNKFFDVMPEILIGVAIDVVTRREASFVARLGVESPISQILALAFLTLIIWVCESLFEYWYGVHWQNLAQLVQHEFRMDAFRHVQKLEMEWFDGTNSGQVVSILNDDINQLERFLSQGANSLLQVASAVLFIGTAFFIIAWDVACVAMLPIPIILWGAARYKIIAEPMYADVREKSSRIAARLTSSISGIATIKGYAAEHEESKRVEHLSQEYVTSNQRAIRVNSAFTPVIRMAVLSGFVATLVIAGFKTIHGTMVVGSFGILVFLTQRLLWPFTSLGQTVDLYQRAMASCARVLDLLDRPIHEDRGSFSLLPASVQGSIRFENVSFGYPHRSMLFKDLSFEILPGKTTAIVGATGSGKSTIAKMLLRFLVPKSGRITLDGMDIQDFKIHDLRRVMGWVGQEVFLFSDSIAENISFGLEQIEKPAIRDAAKGAAALEFIERLPEQFETLVGERGQRLSGGQRQRLGLARAIIRKPPILVLDEATSAVDNETERLIQESLESIRRGRTVLVIAHRLTTVQNADHIIVLDRGKIVEQGTHQELLKLDGFYSRQIGIKK